MGLLGYVGDEIRFCRKEIAIRKVNGADTCGILKLFSANVLWTALPAGAYRCRTGLLDRYEMVGTI